MSSKPSVFEAKNIHFVGIKGVGMTSLALCVQDLGIGVTGSDTEEVFVTDEILVKRGIKWRVGFEPKSLVPKPDLVITTGAHGGFNNPEVIAAKEQGIPVLSHAEALGEFAKGKDLITVAGVGGKTTIASMVSTLLNSAGLHPSFAVGVGNITALGVPGRYDKDGRIFVTEADEFAISPRVDNRPRFTYQNPKILIIPNIEHDHPDIYPTFKDTKKVFLEFMNRVPKDGLLIACIDNPNVRELIKHTSVPRTTYGFSPDSDWKIGDVEFKNEQATFSLRGPTSFGPHEYGEGEWMMTCALQVPGRFNVLNATASMVACAFLGVLRSDLKKGITEYSGCKRRIEKVGEKNGIALWDDYAYHPKEIKAVLSALRDWYPDRPIVAVFQPHTYSRTKALFDEFAQSFGQANKVVLMDVYASARETDTMGVDSKKLAEEIKKYHNQVEYTGGQKETLEYLAKNLQHGDVIVTLGAGDIFHMHTKLLERLK